MMILIALILKPVAWFYAFRFGTRSNMDAMLLSAAGITLVLTLIDKVSVESNMPSQALVLTLVLYTLMSFTLISLAWKVNNTTLSKVLNLIGVIGAFAGVNFFMDFFRGLQPALNQ